MFAKRVTRAAGCFALPVLLAMGCRASLGAEESLWIEAEHLDGIAGYCWPMGGAAMRKTDGHWGISGPGWAAEWNQGGESGFLSIACGAEDDRAIAGLDINIPQAGTYQIWLRYRDVRESTDRVRLRLEQGANKWEAVYGADPVVDENAEAKLYWNWAFGWESHEAPLQKGKAHLSLQSAFKEADCRQIDCIVLTTDKAYRPTAKERPASATWDYLEKFRRADEKLEPLARNGGVKALPAAWQPKTFHDQGFRYLWTIEPGNTKWLSGGSDRLLYPYAVKDKDVVDSFEKKYAGSKDVPIFSDPRIVPLFRNGLALLQTDSPNAEAAQNAAAFVRWLNEDPKRAWGTFGPISASTAAANENFLKLRDRYVGSIARESLGHFSLSAEKIKAAAASQASTGAVSRRELAAAISRAAVAAATAAQVTEWGKPYVETIPVNSVGGLTFFDLNYLWGARTVGYETAVIPGGPLALQWAFLRGAARQNGGLTATYRYYRYGDSQTTFSPTNTYANPRNIFDNYYSVYSGPGVTWANLDMWYEYMAGSSMFLEEDGSDAFWRPGGTGAGGYREVELSPKGKLVDRFLRLTARDFDRGAPYTPVAFLVDYAHGWDPAPYVPHQFGNLAEQPERTRYGMHEKMLSEYFSIAFHPLGPQLQEPVTAVNHTYIPGSFGDIFDVIYAYPDVARWSTIDTYPVVVVAGDMALTEAEGKRLNQYVRDGGTLLVADGQLQGPGAAAMELPQRGAEEESSGYKWLGAAAVEPSQRYRLKPITGGRALAQTPEGKSICSAFEQGKGRMIYLSIPYGLGIDRATTPITARLVAHLTRGLLPVEVRGDVEWSVNRIEGGWAVTILNPAGVSKPQQGMVPIDYRQSRTVTLTATTPIKSARDRLSPNDKLNFAGTTLTCGVPAGGVRIIELR